MSTDPRPAHRDYAAEVRALIDSETAAGTYHARDVAARIVAKLEIADPELLHGWLTVQATTVMYQAICSRDRSLRGHARRAAAAGAFEAQARAAEAAGAPMGQWLMVPYSIGNGERKPLGEMTAAELFRAADAYGARATESRMVEAFLRAVARRCPDGTVSRHFGDEQLGVMWNSIVGGGTGQS